MHMIPAGEGRSKEIPDDATLVYGFCGQSNIFCTSGWLSTRDTPTSYGTPRSAESVVVNAQEPMPYAKQWDKQKRINFNDKTLVDPNRSGAFAVHQFRQLHIGWGAGGTGYPWEDGTQGPSSGEYSDPSVPWTLQTAYRTHMATGCNDIRFISMAEGGTGIFDTGTPGDHCWDVDKTGDDSLFEIWRDACWTPAMEALVAEVGIDNIYLAAFVWFQGAADMDNLAHANAYEANLRALLDVAGAPPHTPGFREHMRPANGNTDTLPIVMVRSEDYVPAQHTYVEEIRAAQEAIQPDIPNSVLVDCDSCRRETTGPYTEKGEHIDAEGHANLGNLIAAGALGLDWVQSPGY